MATTSLAIGAALVPACGFEAENLPFSIGGDGGNVDAPPDQYIPDAAPCTELNNGVCVADERLRKCVMQGQLPEESICHFGCSSQPTAHCRLLQPSGNAVQVADVDPANPMNAMLTPTTINLGQDGTINTGTGEIRVGGTVIRQGGANTVNNGIHFYVRNNVGIFRFDSLVINGPAQGSASFEVEGDNALAIVAIKTIDVTGNAGFDLQGDCDGRDGGAGGGDGGGPSQGAGGGGGGGAGIGIGGGNGCTGGGGGGNGQNGANGGGVLIQNRGGTSGSVTIPTLRGGGGGGGGGAISLSSPGGSGGGGGGAIQLVANERVTFMANVANAGNGIQASGCGGKPAGGCGGAGGAGGTILIESKEVVFARATFVANGGGGAGAANGGGGAEGATTTQAPGGNGGTNGGSNNDGGSGGNGGHQSGGPTAGASRDQHGGGGGGGLGWIRINTKTSTISATDTYLSPSSGPGSLGPTNAQ